MKVKRTKSIYRSKHLRPRNPLVVVVTVIAAALLVFVGWSIAGPLGKMASGQWKPTQSSSSKTVKSASSGSSSSKESSSQTAQTQSSWKGVFLTKDSVSSLSSLDQNIASMKKAGINLAVIDFKAEDGVVNYDSSAAKKIDSSLVSSSPIDATSIAAKLKANGITPAARICCFRDNATPQVLTGAAVKYSGNHSYMWYDANKKFWLNPYSGEAQQYLISLAGEAVSMGYTQIYLDGLTFPDNGRPSVNAWFGSDTTATKEETLKSFVAAAKQAVNTAGGKVNVMMPSAASMGQGETITGQDQSIYSYDADGFCPNLCPTLLSALSKIGDQSVTNAEKNPGDTVTAAATYLAGESTGSQLSGTVPFIQAYSGAKTYGATEISAQISALKSKGITSYILYNPDGQYDLSSLSVK